MGNTFSRILLRSETLVKFFVIGACLNSCAIQAHIFKKEWTIKTVPGQGFHGPFIATEDNSFTYGYCKYEDSKSKLCFLITEKSISPVATYTNECSFNIFKNESLILWPVTLSKKNKHLVFTWTTNCTSVLTIRSIDMTNCNVSFKLTNIKQIRPFHEMLNFVWHSDSFDVFYVHRSYDGNCSEYVYFPRNNTGIKFKATYDLDGNKIGHTIPFLSKEHLDENAKIYSIQNRSPSQDFFFHTITPAGDSPSTGNILTVSLMDSEGVRKDLKNLTVKLDYNQGDLNVKTSSRSLSNKTTISLCWTLKDGNDLINCREFDSNLDRVINSSHSLHHKAALLGLYNLPGGGFLMLTGRCASTVECSQFDVWRVEADGRRRRFYEIVGFEFLLDSEKRIIQKTSKTDELVVEISENLRDEFCFHFYQKREKFTWDDPNLRNQVMKFTKFCLPRGLMVP